MISVFDLITVKFGICWHEVKVDKACVVHQMDGITCLPATVCECILKCFKAIEIYSTGEKNKLESLTFQTYAYHSSL